MELKYKFEWKCRYSETEDSDKHKRWARLCYYNNKLISWVSRIENDEVIKCYTIKDFFPSVMQDDPCLCRVECCGKDFEIIKKETEDRFKLFIEDIL